MACTVGPVHAFSLGKLRGAALVGQPLELSVGVQLAPDDETATQCLGAEVMYGDALVEASSVSVRLVTPATGGGSIAVSVRRPVDEPVVTVYLRSGCKTAVSRKYVLLAELVSESLPVLKPQEPQAVAAPSKPNDESRGSTPALVATPATPAAPAQAGPTTVRRQVARPLSPSVERAEVAVPAKLQPVPADSSAVTRRATERKAGSVAGAARLKLTPLELSADWDPSLRMSTQLSEANPVADTVQRTQALALWRAMQATPEDILQEAVQRAALEKDLAELTRQSRSNQQSIAEMTATLRKAQDSRMANPAMFVLLALLVACGAVLGARARSARAASASALPWWLGRGRDAVNSELQAAHSVPSKEGPRGGFHASTRTVADAPPMATSPAGGPTHVPSAISTEGTGRTSTADPAVSSFRPSDFGHSVTGALRSINTQEMHDARQQAEFFLALGQHDEAARLLQSALTHNSEANPHIYLDLLSLLHRLGRRDDYEHTRAAFMERYTGLVPAFGDSSPSGKCLLDYPSITDALVKAWSTRFVLEYIEQCVVREPSDAPQAGFDLEAFKELLLLHAMRNNDAPEPESAAGGTRPAFRVLPSGDAASARAGAKASWGTAMPLDLDLS